MRTQLRQQKEDKEPNNDWGGKGVHQSKCTCQWVSLSRRLDQMY